MDNSKGLDEVVTDIPTQNDTVERDNDNREEKVGNNPPDETKDINEPQNEQTESLTTEGDSSDQRQPNPYYLRPLPRGRNYNSTDH